jgi:hypothetical protein
MLAAAECQQAWRWIAASSPMIASLSALAVI